MKLTNFVCELLMDWMNWILWDFVNQEKIFKSIKVKISTYFSILNNKRSKLSSCVYFTHKCHVNMLFSWCRVCNNVMIISHYTWITLLMTFLFDIIWYLIFYLITLHTNYLEVMCTKFSVNGENIDFKGYPIISSKKLII